jgi:DNA-binding protein HU-beta
MAQLGKKEFIDVVQASVELGEGEKFTKKDAARAVDAVLTALYTSLANGDDVALQGHGVYEVRTRAAHTGRNPQTGESIDIPETKTVGLRVTGLKNSVK